MVDDFPLQPAVPPAATRRRPLPPPAVRDSAAPLVPDATAPDLWRRYLTAMRRYKWFVLGVTLGGTGLGALSTRWLRPLLHIYAARANIWIDATSDPHQRGPTPTQGPIQSGQLLGAAGWVDLLRSDVVLDDVVRERGLYLAPASPAADSVLSGFEIGRVVHAGAYRFVVDKEGRGFTLFDDGSGKALQHGRAGDSVGAAQGFVWVPPAAVFTPGRTAEFSVSSPHDAAVALGQKLQVDVDPDGNFMSVQLRGPDQLEVAAIVNAVAERFVGVAAELKRAKLKELAGILDDQLLHAQASLREAEAALQTFRVRTVTLFAQGAAPLAGQAAQVQYSPDPVFAHFFEAKVTREQIRRDRAGIEQIVAEIPASGVPVDALQLIASVQHSPELTQALVELTAKQAELRALRYRYSESYAPLRRLAVAIDTLQHKGIPMLARTLIGALSVREATLGREIDSASAAIRQIPPLAIEEVRLEREVASAEQLFTKIQQRQQETRLAEVSSIPDVRVLDRAIVPESPWLNATPFLVIIAFVGSCSVGMLGAVVRDRVDPRVQRPDQVTEEMGLTILGAVPHLSRRNGDNAKGTAQVIEALRGVRLNTLHAHGTGPVLLTITSPGTGDGKSLVASNLALAFAEADYRTLLIDGDVRRGMLHRTLGAPRRPGLTDVLVDGVPLEQAVRPTRYESLAFIGCGARTRRAPELLGSAAMVRLLTSLRATYQAIIIDSPPLAAGVDAYALATATGALLLVLRSGVSNRELTGTKLSVLDRLPVRVLGAVLNDVREGGAYRYYSYYLAGYELGDEPETKERGVLHSPA